ncbi:MAG: diphosphate--fructose-6-phosphate 1-phosphotransferase, partial [Bacilli bacterium]|nr:diphosphate--fructose-6-phosphate 1-phosphotransferase [Bacilli bacterium]
MKGNVLYGQSGGPSSVINSSALGVFLEARRQRDKIDKIFVMKNGIVGAIKNQVCEITSQNTDLLKLRHTSGAIFGSSRYKLDDCKIRPAEYLAIVKTLQAHNIRYFFLNGGNDSMDTCNKINNYLQMVNYECRVIGIPKTIDNDLVGIDHSPGYGSSAKFIANLMIELDLDNSSYPMGRVVIVEIMGRNAGWLAASAKLASIVGHGPDLIYVPEVSFDSQSFVDRVKKIYQTKNRVLIAVSEGINYREACRLNIGQTDPFGHRVLGGVSYALASLIKEKLSLETKVINMGMAQRSAARISSLTDIR